MSLIENTPAVSSISADEFYAIVVAGGQSPMFTFSEATGLQALFTEFYREGKVSAALCHGTSLLIYIEDEARKLGANYVSKNAFESFAVRDGHLVTGQQQNSGRETAELVIDALGR
jgi:putative intracellular protease/amidase